MVRGFAFVPVVIFSLTLFAQTSPPSVTTSGTAELLVDPDQVEISVGTETMHATLRIAKELNDAAIAKTIAAAKRNGIDAASIQTDYISINPNYVTRRTTPDSYTVRRSLVITSKDVSQFERLLTDLIEAGANQVQSIEFRTSKLRERRDEARRMATKAAHEKAQLLATSLGRTIGKALQITEGNDGWSAFSSWRGGWSANMAMNVSQNAGVAETPSESPLAPGRISVRATVSVVFALE